MGWYNIIRSLVGRLMMISMIIQTQGRMAQLVEHPVQFNQLSGRSLRPPASSSAAAMKIAIGAYSPKHLVAWLSW